MDSIGVFALLSGLMGCSGGGDSGETGLEDVFSVMSEQIPNAMLLSAHSDGDEAIIVGGELHGGSGSIVRYDGSRICLEADVTEEPLWWIHGASEGEWYAVGAEGTVLHEVAGERSREDLDTEATLFGVYQNDDGVVYAVGGDAIENTGVIYKRVEGVWSLFAEDLPGTVFKVWRSWFVGVGFSLRLVEGSLIDVPLPGSETLTTIRGRDEDNDVWAVGGVSGVLHFDGTAWERVENPFGAPINGVYTEPDGDVWITGAFGTAAVLREAGWEYSDYPITGEHFHAVWLHKGEPLFLGGNFYSTAESYGLIARYGAEAPALPAEVCQ